ncbi:MAG: tRNA guanosine(34) transglycosylase Tgt [Acidobacteria bacterium]|nr:MAG: tRNA guanosine(34) transglycosylase Tgt [Acidobacteria bacterium 13_2_20CM_58_27]PYT69592.1 MAG: tRNA guanosine(34) transglycosylase Tgt [Acidobacteriota bacterium]PYT90220.1 MAG: tRNA guanosine(34) transglycosylase Tgt [Acidobacteriota bacterium]
MPFLFEVLKTDADGGRCGRLSTPHGVVETPFFLPVGTQASVKALTQEVLEELGVEIILANTYHLYLRPGHELVRRFGGLHRFMSWPRAILTDSGGYQVFSLSELRKVTDEGVRFRSHLDGSEHLLTPEKVAEIQLALGSDIAMVLDECIETPAPRETAEAALQRTTAWARRARAYFQESAHRNGTPVEQWQFGIVQGATFADLRRESARQLLDLDFPGYAVGGLAVGEPHEVTCAMTAEVTALLPKDRPRYLMGVGRPEQIADYVALGIDMMDCVLPTRAARHACLYTSEGRVLIKNSRYAEDQRPIDSNCSCSVCRRYSRAYLRHLFAAGEMTAAILATYHNVHFYLDIMRRIREAIGFGNLAKFSSEMHARYTVDQLENL